MGTVAYKIIATVAKEMVLDLWMFLRELLNMIINFQLKYEKRKRYAT